MKCPHCGAPVHENDQICSFCGAELPVIHNETKEEAPKTTEVAAETPEESQPEPARETIVVTPKEEAVQEEPLADESLPIDEDDEALNTALNAFMDDDEEDENEGSKTKIFIITGAVIIAIILLVFGRNLIPAKDDNGDIVTPPDTSQPVDPNTPTDPVDDIDTDALNAFLVSYQNEYIKVLNGEDNNISQYLLEGSEAYKYFDAYEADGRKVTLLEIDTTSITKDPSNTNKLNVKIYEKVEISKANTATKQEINNRLIVLVKNDQSWLVESVEGLVPAEDIGKIPTQPTKPTQPTTPTAPPVSDGFKASGSFSGGVNVDNQGLKDIRFGVNEGFERLVIDFTGHDNIGNYTATISDDGMKITITLNGNKTVAVDDLTFASSVLIKNVDTYQSSNENLASIVINLHQPVQMKVFDLKAPVRLVVDIMNYGK